MVGKRFDLRIDIGDTRVRHLRILFDNCQNIGDVRGWLNSCGRWIDIGDYIYNCDNILKINICESEQQGDK